VVILCKTKVQADQALEFIRKQLKRLKLELSEEKTTVTSFKAGFDFLGFRFEQKKTVVAGQSLKSFYRKMKETSKRHQGDIPLEAIIARLNPIIRGWGNYHKKGQNVRLFKKLDRWIRMRLRAYVKKRWCQFWSTPTTKDLENMGLVSMYDVIRPKELQLELF